VTATEKPPTLTHAQQLRERRAANAREAAELVFGALGDPAAGTAAEAFAKGALVAAVAKALEAAEDRGPDTPRVIPAMELVARGDLEPIPVGSIVAWMEAGGEITEGLRCPHCGAVAWNGHDGGVTVIDVSERRSDFGYQVGMVDGYEYVEVQVPDRAGTRTVLQSRPTGEKELHRAVTGGWADSDHHTTGYACTTCERRVTLPEGIEEESI
jgi:DNA-directed RNA polymerase subunit RPC12/RpoP